MGCDLTALILGRALHSPWNEGTRVINRNFAVAASGLRKVRLVSLTNGGFRNQPSNEGGGSTLVEHVYTRSGYDLLGVYRGLPRLLRYLHMTDGGNTIDVAHLFPGIPLSVAPWLCRRGTRIVAHVMTDPVGLRVQLLNRASTAIFDRWVDAYVVSSPALIPLLAQRSLRTSKIFVVPPAIDTGVYRPGDRRAARRELGLDPDERCIVYLGRMSPHRFPAGEIASVLASVVASGQERVRIVGLSPGQTYDGSENTDMYLQACGRAAEEQLRQVPGLTVDIRVGNLTDESKVAWLRGADAVLLPFTVPEAVEPPLALLEALACGATVLASPVANRSGIVQHGINGLIYHTPHQLASQLSDVVNQRLEPDLSNQACRTVVRGFSFAAVADVIAEVWDQIEA